MKNKLKSSSNWEDIKDSQDVIMLLTSPMNNLLSSLSDMEFSYHHTFAMTDP